MKKGVDVSAWQGKISKDAWLKAKADGVAFAIIRIGYNRTLNKDSKYDNNIKTAKQAGIPVGVYYYSTARSVAEAKAEANYCLKLLGKTTLDLPVYFDYEDPTATKSVGKATGTNMVNAFCKIIKNGGYKAGVYASLNFLNNKLNPGDFDKHISIWCAQYYKECQYKGTYDIWQYSSSGSVAGLGKPIDMDKMVRDILKSSSSSEPQKTEPAKVTSVKVPSLTLKKTTQQVIDDTIKWAKWIAGDNRFHYGYTNKHGSKDSSKWSPNAHHNGCYFCGTNTDKGGRSKKGITDYERTYCCNPFVHAAWAHGGCDQTALGICQKGSSWNFEKGTGYDKSSLFKNLGHPKKSELKAGDVLCRDTHVALYIGGGKIAEASGGDDNKKNSEKWNNSIHIKTLTDDNYKKFPRVHRYIGSVNATCYIRHGEISDRVKDLQNFLDWYYKGAFSKECGPADGYYGDNTFKWVAKYQVEKFGKGEGDGIVGPKTIAAMEKDATPAPAPVDYKKVALDVIAGKYGNGNDRVRNLKAAGYDPDKVQEKVNELIAVRNKTVDAMNAWATKIAGEKYHYVKWNSDDPKTKTCPVCTGRKYDDHYGWNCIGFSFAVWHHGGGIKCNCNCHVVSNGVGEKILAAKTDAEALALTKKYVGVENIQLIRNKNGIPKSQWQPGDICLKFDGDTYKHTFYYMGGGKVTDSTGSNGKVPVADQIKTRNYKNYSAKIIIRWTGWQN